MSSTVHTIKDEATSVEHPGMAETIARLSRRVLPPNIFVNKEQVRAIAVITGVLVLVWYFAFSSPKPETPPAAVRSLSNFRTHGSCLATKNREFFYKNRPIRILSGAMHYFRVPSAYWRDRLLKLQAMGLNTVETYIPWNLHEPEPGKFDFDGMLNIREFVSIAAELGLFVILRPGPYICSEWDYGGLPAWLLRDDNMKVRTLYPPFVEAVERYFDTLIPALVPMQCYHGGPVIALQIENEYGSYGEDASYMRYLKKAIVSRGIKELLFTSDNRWGKGLTKLLLPEVLQTANFRSEWKMNMDLLTQLQPKRPLMVMELWSGWFDHWGEAHHRLDSKKIGDTVANLLKIGASINFYMFHGGTNFGFLNGANIENNAYLPTITSYDYDAPLSESGEPTEKFFMLQSIIKKFVPSARFPPLPAPLPKKNYGFVVMHLCLPLLEALSYLPAPTKKHDLLPMELLDVNSGSGQAYGYTLYRTDIPGSSQKVRVTNARDWALVLTHGQQPFVLEKFLSAVFDLKPGKKTRHRLTILVENMGRVNYGNPREFSKNRKGLLGSVEVDDTAQFGWTIYSVEFKPDFVASVSQGGTWERSPPADHAGPTLFKSNLRIDDEPADTFIDMRGWGKGAVFINNVNIGRYWEIGPQQTLYVPAPILRKGINSIIVFELLQAPEKLTVAFVDQPLLSSGPMKWVDED